MFASRSIKISANNGSKADKSAFPRQMRQVTFMMLQKLSDSSHSDLAAALTHLATISRGCTIPRKTTTFGKTTIINVITF